MVCGKVTFLFLIDGLVEGKGFMADDGGFPLRMPLPFLSVNFRIELSLGGGGRFSSLSAIVCSDVGENRLQCCQGMMEVWHCNSFGKSKFLTTCRTL